MKRALLVFVMLAAVALAAAPVSSARAVGIKVRGVTSCSPTRPYVRLADGTVERVPHARPGPLLSRVTHASTGFRLLVRFGASWRAVTGGTGQRVVVTARGPRGEVWQFGLRLRSSNPLVDRTAYVACVGLVSTKGKPFLARMRNVRGAWRFDVRVVAGSLRGSSGSFSLRVA